MGERLNLWLARATRVFKYLVLAAIVVIVGFLIVRFLDVLFATSLYSWFFQPLADSGIPDRLSGAVAVWLAAIVILALPTFLADVIWRRRTAVLKIAGAISVWFVVAYFISLPKAGQLFNPATGSPMYMYSQSADGTITLLPMGYHYDPRTGKALKSLDGKTAEKYLEQGEKSTAQVEKPAEAKTPPETSAPIPKTEPPKRSAQLPLPGPAEPPAPKKVQPLPTPAKSKLPPPPPKPAYPTYKLEQKPVTSKGGRLYGWVEEVQLRPAATIVKFACRGVDEKLGGVLWPAGGYPFWPPYDQRAYAVDDQGNSANLVRDSANYNMQFNSDRSDPERRTEIMLGMGWKGDVRPYETYRFTLEFGPLNPGAKLIRVFHPEFGTIEIPLQ